MRPPLPDEPPPAVPSVPLKALSCRNQRVSLAALISSDSPAAAARLVLSDLRCGDAVVPAETAAIRLVGTVPTPEAGLVCDPLLGTEQFPIDRSAAVYVTVPVPRGIPAGTYRGGVTLLVNEEQAATAPVKLEVANVDLPDLHDSTFFLGVWMNPATIARWHGVEVWSDEHFRLLEPYVHDLAEHGQKTVVAPICYQPWGTQTRNPYPNLIRTTRRNGRYEFDFSLFDRYVRLHEKHGIDRAIHCYSLAQGPGAGDQSIIEYIDADTGQTVLLQTTVGDEQYTLAWSAFLDAFAQHLRQRGWMDKTYLGLDEKPPEVMERLIAFAGEHAPGFKLALAGNTTDKLMRCIDDLCLHIGFNERGVAQSAPPERAAMGMAQLLDPDNVREPVSGRSGNMLTTYYVCCGPPFPNTFLFSPLVESRMLPWLAAQGGFDGFLRWSYSDWPDDPYQHPEYGRWPTGDTFFVYPGHDGPVSSLRWQQLLEGIYDYELAMIAAANTRTSEEMVDYEQAITLACRNPDGRTKAVGDIEIARRLLIPIAEHQTDEG